MSNPQKIAQLPYQLIILFAILLGIFSQPAPANAHPLGNFTINHFSRLHLDPNRVTVQYVVDMAEIPAFQALQVADGNGDRTTSNRELQTYLTQITPRYMAGLVLQIDAQPVPLALISQRMSLPPGAGGLATLRLEWSLTGTLPARKTQVSTLDFADHNDRTRIGWREIVVDPTSPWQLFNSSAYSNSLTDALRAYPEDLLTTPLQESAAHLSFTSGELPSAAMPLLTRTGQSLPRHRSVFSTLAEWKTRLSNNNYQRLPLLPPLDGTTTGGMAMAIVAAFIWGAMHSMTPGHGKTLVGAYLIGTKATPQHALLLALTTTITHTIGVFVLGLITLFAAEYVLPEQLYPWLSLGSGIMVAAIGGNLLAQRWPSFRPDGEGLANNALTLPFPKHEHGPAHFHHHGHSHHHGDHHHAHSHHDAHAHHHREQQFSTLAIASPGHLQLDPEAVHLHATDHLLGADALPVTWQSLVVLGISGGLMPCPAALVLLLGTIAIGQVRFGLILVFVFSLGLAGVLTGLGLLLVYAKHLFKTVPISLQWIKGLPALGALSMTIVGLGISTLALLTLSGVR